MVPPFAATVRTCSGPNAVYGDVHMSSMLMSHAPGASSERSTPVAKLEPSEQATRKRRRRSRVACAGVSSQVVGGASTTSPSSLAMSTSSIFFAASRSAMR